MKNTIITISLILSLAASSFAGTVSKKENVNTAEFAYKLVTHFGNENLSLNEIELVDMLNFLNANIPAQTPSTNMATRMSRSYNLGNGASGDNGMIDLRAIDQQLAKTAKKVLARFDVNGDKELCDVELAAALEASGVSVTRG